MAYTCTQSRWLCTLARFRTVAILAQAIVCSSHFCSLRSYIILIGDALGAGPAPAASFCSSTPRPCLQPRGLDHFSQTRRAMLNARVCHATSSTRHTLPTKKVINWTMACSHWRRCGGTFSHVIILKPMLNLNVALTVKRSTFVYRQCRCSGSWRSSARSWLWAFLDAARLCSLCHLRAPKVVLAPFWRSS